jgi:hypothetical protein
MGKRGGGERRLRARREPDTAGENESVFDGAPLAREVEN